MTATRKMISAIILTIAFLAIQQAYLDSSGGASVYAQANIDAGDVSGAPGAQVDLPLTFVNNTPPDVVLLNFSYAFDSNCLTFDGATYVIPGFLTCLSNTPGILGCLEASAGGPLPDGQFASIQFTLTNSPSCNNQTFNIVAYEDPNLPPDAYICKDANGISLDCAQTDGTITNDTTLAVTLGWVLAEVDGETVDFQWQTATESGVAGFNVLAVVNGERVQLNDSLIASPVIDSVTLTDYLVSFETDATTFYLQEIGIDSRVVEHGPYTVGAEEGTYSGPDGTNVVPAVWLPFVPTR